MKKVRNLLQEEPLVETAMAGDKEPFEEHTAATAADGVGYEIPLVPPPGFQTIRATVGSTYGPPIPVDFCPQNRTAYPVRVK